LRKFATSFAIALAALTCAQVDPNRIVATVNGEDIKGAEYYRRMEYLNGVGKVSQGGFAEFPPGFLTIEQLITEKLILQLAKEKGVLPTDAEVEAEMKVAEEDDPKFLEQWLATGRTRAEMVAQTRVNLAQFKLITRGITVTDGEVEKFYNDNPTLFTVPKLLHLRILVVDTDEKAKAADADLAAGKKFEDVVKAHTIDDFSKKNGGDFGNRSWEDLSPEARSSLENVAAGGASGWIPDPSTKTRVKFYVVKVTPPSKRPLNATLRRSVRREQMMAKGRVANTLQKDMSEMRKRAQITIAEKSFSDAYRKFIDGFLGGGG
jgi:foldase protein PrsA